jgi:hypothetical protein
MHPAAVLDALVDGVGFVRSRATTLNQGLLSDSTVVILVSQLVGVSVVLGVSVGWCLRKVLLIVIIVLYFSVQNDLIKTSSSSSNYTP